MSLFLKSLPNGEYSIFFIAASFSDKTMTKLGNLIFTIKFMMQSYKHNFCNVAPEKMKKR